MGWTERWLVARGASPEQARALAERARDRAGRYPFPIGLAHPLVERALNLAPLALLGRLCRADRLDDGEFARLEAALQHHRLPAVRALHLLARAPALEGLYPDAAPDAPAHPLDALEDANRARQSHWRQTYDVIVIGSGAGGAPLARDLAQRGFTVAVLEAGERLTAASTGDALERHYLMQGLTGSLTRSGMTLVLAGKAVGGTTVVNSGTSLRPLQSQLGAWDRGLGTRFAETLHPWLDAAEAGFGVGVPDRRLLDASARIMERGFAAIGREGAYVLPRNAPDCQGAGRCCFGCPNGAKLSTDRAFLPAALAAGAVLFSGTRASSIRESDRGVEVLVRGPAGVRRLRARRLVVSAGALSTPGLLRANRLGSRWREAGDGLRFHPASKAFGLMPDALPHGGIPQGLGYKAPELERVTFEGVHTPPGAAAPMIAAAGARHRWWMDRYERLATFGMMVRDRGEGSVRTLGGARVLDYALHPADADDLGAALKITAEALFAAGAERVLLPLTHGAAEVDSMDALRRLPASAFTPNALLTCGFHPFGTAAMGAVVEPSQRLVGSERIYVSDASVLPASPGVNPQVTIAALALRCADHIAQDLAGPVKPFAAPALSAC